MSEGARVWPGRPFPLGATVDAAGVNFALYSEHAHSVEVCLFDPKEPWREVDRFLLPGHTAFTFHAYVPGVRAGTAYGFRVHGHDAPEKGHRFNPNYLLVDPYARAVTGAWIPPAQTPVGPNAGEVSAGVPKGVVVSGGFDWTGDGRPRTPWHETVLYELHVKGFTQQHPDVPPELRGTFAGLGHPAAVSHLKALGVTAVELLPVHQSVPEGTLLERGLTNYWGYNTLSYFAPDHRFSSQGSLGGQVEDFQTMVKALHRAGIEVLLDVVFNHTCEGNQHGPSLSFRGIDNDTYYRLKADDPREYEDFTGCGNTVDLRHPQVVKLVMDSLRYWAEQMHVDGFRFDLATVLGREAPDFRRHAAFFQTIHQDPVLSKLKLIAEPWDLGEGGYRVANFPVLWSEWNDKYRDAVRRFWKGDGGVLAELGYRLTGSSDLYRLSGRGPFASVNYVTAHDGFTLRDLVSYERKHNEANAEGNRDGADQNHSWNCGVEGETQDTQVNALRDQQARNLLATLFLSQGIPMVCAGDEQGRTQGGNNNAYCQDSPVSWVDWALDDRRRSLLAFARRLIRLRQEQPVLQRRKFFRGEQIWDSAFKDLAWFLPSGREMSAEDWKAPHLAFAYLLGGDAISTLDDRGERILGDTLLVLMNAERQATSFVLPAIEWGAGWEPLLDTAHPLGAPAGSCEAGGGVQLVACSLLVMRRLAAKGP